ncbi:hypothetical protein NQZ79_g6874 [Umbelopsis isabellina]|nr:hypothetical protein NQZ79_g6874 [Umbelopsis isabellina]
MLALPAGKVVQVDDISVVIVRFLAEGGFSHVYLVNLEIEDQNIKTRQAVLKQIHLKDALALEKAKNEIDVMKQLTGHKNIIEYFASQIIELEDANPYNYEVLILMEYGSGGEVVDMMNKRMNNRMTEHEILDIFADAVLWMHSSKPPILHRDLKVENLLVSEQGVYKLCDFGSATTLSSLDDIIAEGKIEVLAEDINRQTTLQYRAPELVDMSRRMLISEKIDVWALGILLYKLCYYITPFEENSEANILQVSYTFPKIPYYSPYLQQLINSILRANPDDRPNVEQIKKRVDDLRISPPVPAKKKVNFNKLHV